MSTETQLARTEPQVKPPVHWKVAVSMERGSISLSREGLTFCISGKNVKLHRESPLILTFDSGEVEFDDGEIAVRAEGEAIRLHLD
jgi:hypothetical protein